MAMLWRPSVRPSVVSRPQFQRSSPLKPFDQSKPNLKTLLSEGLSEPEFYGDLVYKFKKLKGINDFSFQFRKIITRY